jgi:ribonuclease D
LLKVLLRIVAEQQSVAPKMLASSEDIEQIASKGEHADVPALQGWRREVFGEQALKLIQGEVALKFEKRRIAVVEAQG